MAGAADFVIRTPLYGSGSKTAYTATPGITTIPAGCQSVLVFVTTIAYVRVGATPASVGAVTSGTDLPLPANAPIIIPVPLNLQTGGPIQVSAIQDTSGGNMFCFGMTD